MSNNYDNWERLVVAVLRREKDRQLALAHSRESSISSESSSFNFRLDFPVHERSLQLEASSSKVNETDRERLFPSATSSSAGLSRFSAAESDDTCASGEILPTSNLKIFTFAELEKATRNFESDMILGSMDMDLRSMGFRTVFKGWVDSKTLAPSFDGAGMPVVIKKPAMLERFGTYEIITFEMLEAMLDFLGRVSHPNVAKLLGYCWERGELSLVYEFMQRRSLENHLFRSKILIQKLREASNEKQNLLMLTFGSDVYAGDVAIEPLSWDIRLKIAIGAARGLDFLNSSRQDMHIYSLFSEASSILLDVDYNAKILVFGFSSVAPWEWDLSRRYGYELPPYLRADEPLFLGDHRHIVKSDVYSFGLVLLEMLTGLCAYKPFSWWRLINDVKPFVNQPRKLMSVMDARMEGQYSSKAALQAAQLAIKCLHSEPSDRPSMKKVVAKLEEIAAIRKTRRIQN